MDQWKLMRKGDEEKLVHPGNVENHQRLGWELVSPSQSAEVAAPVTEIEAAQESVVEDLGAEIPETAAGRKAREKAERAAAKLATEGGEQPPTEEESQG